MFGRRKIVEHGMFFKKGMLETKCICGCVYRTPLNKVRKNNDLIRREGAIDVIKSLQITLDGESIFHPAAKTSVLECLDFVPAADAVLCDEYEALLRRFRHLLQSKFIRSFDEYDRNTHTYKRDIAEADRGAPVQHGLWLQDYELYRGMEDYSEIPFVQCSKCGHKEYGIDFNDYSDLDDAPNYCPNCGAKMDARSEEA